jgi:hypothetical protein
MAHFAELDENNIVKQVIVVHNNELLIDGVETESKGAQFCHDLFGGKWVQTSYHNNIRKQYAGAGMTYDPVNDVFIRPQPYPSWILDDNFDWQPPTPKPLITSEIVDPRYVWNEDTQNWVLIV